MNKTRRKKLADLAVRMDALRTIARNGYDELLKVRHILRIRFNDLDGIKDDEQEAHDNKPEGLQSAGQDALDDFNGHVEDAKEAFSDLDSVSRDEYDSDDIDNWFDNLADALSCCQD